MSGGVRLSTTLRNLVARPRGGEDADTSPAERRRLKIARGIVAGVVLTLAASMVGVVVWLLWPAAPTGIARVGPDGTQVLQIACSGCDDKTDLALGPEHASVSRGSARITMATPVGPQTNSLIVNATDPSGNQKSLELDVRVCGRLSPDLSRLGDPEPALALVAEVPLGGSAIVDGNALAPDDEGRTSYRLPLADGVMGDADSPKTLSRAVPFNLTAPGCADQRGSFAFNMKIAALRVSAPSASIVLGRDTFMLAGKAQAGSVVAVEGRKIAVGANGAFAQRMTISQLGEKEITIRASVPGFAPRLVRRRIRRVADLLAEAKAQASKTPSRIQDVLETPAASGSKRFALRGRVERVETIGHRSRMVVTAADCAAAKCEVRVDHGAIVPANAGDSVIAIGDISVTGSGDQKSLHLTSELLAVETGEAL